MKSPIAKSLFTLVMVAFTMAAAAAESSEPLNPAVPIGLLVNHALASDRPAVFTGATSLAPHAGSTSLASLNLSPAFTPPSGYSTNQTLLTTPNASRGKPAAGMLTFPRGAFTFRPAAPVITFRPASPETRKRQDNGDFNFALRLPDIPTKLSPAGR